LSPEPECRNFIETRCQAQLKNDELPLEWAEWQITPINDEPRQPIGETPSACSTASSSVKLCQEAISSRLINDLALHGPLHGRTTNTENAAHSSRQSAVPPIKLRAGHLPLVHANRSLQDRVTVFAPFLTMKYVILVAALSMQTRPLQSDDPEMTMNATNEQSIEK
jgi:hypothetical protein